MATVASVGFVRPLLLLCAELHRSVRSFALEFAPGTAGGMGLYKPVRGGIFE
jgi:hypothetical protein